MNTPELKACPFCGAGETRLQENGKMWTGMRYSEPVSVSVLHYCTPVAGQPSRAIERIGRDEASAIEAWNRRYPSPMSADNRKVAYSAANKLRELGLVWDGEEWK